jgi:putative metalloenzyme radical SAM/SPASM domain maturase
MCVRQNDESRILEGDLAMETFLSLEPAFSQLQALILNGIGEPLMHPRLEEFIAISRRSLADGAWVGFQTNGILMNEKRASTLVDSGLDRICISVDSVSGDIFRQIRDGGELAAVDRALAALKKARDQRGRSALRVGIEFVLMRDNLRELPEALRFAAAHDVSFAIVSQLLPYSLSSTDDAVYDTNTQSAIAIFKDWERRAAQNGVDVRRYFDVFMKVVKDSDEQQVFDYVEKMKADAVSQDVALQLERLLSRDEAWYEEAERVLEEAERIAADAGIDLTLPEMAPKNTRKCEFVESDSAFISWDGDVHPCYFLWHRYACYVGGWEKKVKPRVFGNLSDQTIDEIWKSPDFRSFREGVRRYEFPFCFDCSFALCNYVDGEEFEHDCYTGLVPCGACLWCTGLFHCMQ